MVKSILFSIALFATASTSFADCIDGNGGRHKHGEWWQQMYCNADGTWYMPFGYAPEIVNCGLYCGGVLDESQIVQVEREKCIEENKYDLFAAIPRCPSEVRVIE